METGDWQRVVLRCSACGDPEVWSWEVFGAEDVSALSHHDPGVDLRLEVLAGSVEVTIGGVVRTYRAGESVIIPTGVARALRAPG